MIATLPRTGDVTFELNNVSDKAVRVHVTVTIK